MPHDVGRGETVTVSGTAWGDSCYDTGPPPAGEGALGVPVPEITVVLVQGAREWELWTGAANADYVFSADVTVPGDASAGVATLGARRKNPPSGWDVETYIPDPELRISAALPISSTSEARTSTTATAPAARATGADDNSDSTLVIVGVIAAGAVMLAAAALAARR
jgi:hypothetical protein